MSEFSKVTILLKGARVTPAFRDAIFAAANRAGMSVNEFVLTAAARHMRQAGVSFPGLFETGDLDLEFSNDNDDGAAPRSAIG